MSEFLVHLKNNYTATISVYADAFEVMDRCLIFYNYREGDGTRENIQAFAEGYWDKVKLQSDE